MFNYQFNEKNYRDKPEFNSGGSKVEKAGYISAKKRIENMMYAGQRLVESRRAQYDFQNDIDENYYDPTRLKSYDMADATQDRLSLEASVKARQNAQKESTSLVNDVEDVDVKESYKKAVEP